MLQREYAGCEASTSLSRVTFLEMRIDAREATLALLGQRLPSLRELKLNHSTVPCLRELGTSLRVLQVLWLSRSGVADLSGEDRALLRTLYLPPVPPKGPLCSRRR